MEKLGSRMGSVWPKVSPKPLESPSVPLQPTNFSQLPSTRSLFVLQQHLATWAGVRAVMLPQPAVTIPDLCALQPKQLQPEPERGWKSVEVTRLKPVLREASNFSRKFLNFSHWTMISALVLGKYPSAPRGVSLQLSGGWGRQKKPLVKLSACCWQEGACSGHKLPQELDVMLQFITAYWGIFIPFNGPYVLYVLSWKLLLRSNSVMVQPLNSHQMLSVKEKLPVYFHLTLSSSCFLVFLLSQDSNLFTLEIHLSSVLTILSL